MANWLKPTLTSTYTDFVLEISGRLDDLALGMGGATLPTNLPENSIRWNSTNTRWEKWVAGSWIELTATYNISVASAPKLTTPKTISLSGHIVGSVSFDGSADVSILSTLADSGAAAGMYGSSTTIPVITVDAKGRVTSVTTTPVGSAGTISTNNATITGGSISGTVIRLLTTAPTDQEGYMVWDPVTDLLKIGNGVAGIKTYVDTETAQVLKNKESSVGCVWNGTPVAINFGGTGANNIISARDNLGLFSMSTQAHTSVNILGGSISGTSIKLPIGTGNINEGQMQWDDNDNLLTIGTGVTAKVMADTDSAQFLTNKVVNGLTLASLASGFKVFGGISSKTLTVENTINFRGIDNTVFTLPTASGTLAAVTQQLYLGSTPIAINRASGAIALTGITSIDGLAGSTTRLATARALNGVPFDGTVNLNTIPLSIVDDTSTNTAHPIVFATGSSGNPSARVSSTKLLFNPLTGILSCPAGFSGSGASLTSIGTAALGGDISTVSKTALVSTTTAAWRTAINAADNVSTQTIWVPAGAMINQTSNPPTLSTVETAGNGLMLKTLNFINSGYKFAQFAVRMPKAWDRGNLSIAFTWSSDTTGGVVTWGAGAVGISTGTALNTTWSDSVALSQSAMGAELCHHSTFAALPITGTITDTTIVYFRVFRRADDTSDTFPGTIRLHGVTLAYTTTALNDA